MRARQIKTPKMYDLQLWRKVDDTYRHVETRVWNSPYRLCKWEKDNREAYKAHFEFYKIVPNQK